MSLSQAEKQAAEKETNLQRHLQQLRDGEVPTTTTTNSASVGGDDSQVSATSSSSSSSQQDNMAMQEASFDPDKTLNCSVDNGHTLVHGSGGRGYGLGSAGISSGCYQWKVRIYVTDLSC